MKIKLHPTVAAAIARAITQRSLATEMINTTIYRKEYKHDDFLFWRNEHIEASHALREMGINVITYGEDVVVGGLQ